MKICLFITTQMPKTLKYVGGLSAPYGGICLNLSKLDKILDYHPEDFDVKVQPGVTRQKLDNFLKSDGVWFPIDPGIYLLTHFLTQNYLHNQQLGIFKKNIKHKRVVINKFPSNF